MPGLREPSNASGRSPGSDATARRGGGAAVLVGLLGPSCLLVLGLLTRSRVLVIGYWDGALWIFGVGLVMVPLTIIAALIAGWSKGTRGPVGWFRILVVAFVLAFVLWLVTAATVETLPIQI